MLGVNSSGHERKNKLSCCPDGQYSIIFEGYLTVRQQDHTIMKAKLKAVLVGGPQNGQAIELDEATPQITILARVLERTGEWRVVFTSKYKLVSGAEPPLRYEFED
jgi:hypothetical protein